MKHIPTFLFILFFAFQAQSQEIDCAEQVAYEQDVPRQELVSSDRYANLVEPVQVLPEMLSTLVGEDFVLTSLKDINRVCFPGTFIYGDDDLGPREDNSYRTDICEPYSKTFEVIYYNHYDGIPGDLSENIFAGPFEVSTMAEHIPGTPYYQFYGSHEVVSFDLGTKYWISIQNIDNDGCEFHLLYNDPERLRSSSTREVSDGFFQLVPGDVNIFDGAQINFALGATGLAPIPTLSQWGIIVLGFMVIIFGVAYMRKEKLGLA